AAAARIGVDRALDHARRTFEWLEEHCRDTEYGGYFELTERDGTPVLDPMDAAATRRDGLASSHGIKTQNTSLHLLEAFTELYRVWPDARVRERIRELMELLTGPFLLDGIHSAQMLYRDLKPATEQISYGHDIEAAHLLLAAARTLGDPLPTGVARGFADYVLVEGRDPVHGGISYFGTPGNSPTQRRKHWWVMPEAILGYLAVYRETMHEGYLRAADELWRWTQEHLVDKEFGGWFGELDEENRVVDDRKGHAWKANYHETRALLFGARVLRSID
ncbi:MAG TPA: AGE family epimerase/isomerase, partial [Fimbriimonas sp.]